LHCCIRKSTAEEAGNKPKFKAKVTDRR